MKFLITGLGNIGEQYAGTRHNIGFRILDDFAREQEVSFRDRRYGFVATCTYKAKTFILLKPSTFVNLSGRAVNYWMQKEKIPDHRMLVIMDDLSLPFGTIRLRAKGGDAGHNGLHHIIQILGHQNFARLRFGTGNGYPRGAQAHYVLSPWTPEEEKQIPGMIKICTDIIKHFATTGVEHTMNKFNKR